MKRPKISYNAQKECRTLDKYIKEEKKSDNKKKGRQQDIIDSPKKE